MKKVILLILLPVILLGCAPKTIPFTFDLGIGQVAFDHTIRLGMPWDEFPYAEERIDQSTVEGVLFEVEYSKAVTEGKEIFSDISYTATVEEKQVKSIVSFLTEAYGKPTKEEKQGDFLVYGWQAHKNNVNKSNDEVYEYTCGVFYNIPEERLDVFFMYAYPELKELAKNSQSN